MTFKRSNDLIKNLQNGVSNWKTKTVKQFTIPVNDCVYDIIYYKHGDSIT